MLSVGVQLLAKTLGVQVRVAQLWSNRPDWPKPTLSAVHGTGRPEKQWLIKDLPEAIMIKGRAVVIRTRVTDALANQLLSAPQKEDTEKASAARAMQAPIQQGKGSVQALAIPPKASNASSAIVKAVAGSLNDTQRRTAEARAALLREIERMTPVIGQEKAITKLMIMAMDGTLAPHLLALVPVANAKPGQGGKRTLSRSTIFNWMRELKAANGAINALAPKDGQKKTKIPEWAADLLAVYQQPQKPSLRWSIEQIAPKYPHIDIDNLYDRAARFLKKMGNVELQAGRMGSRDLKNIKPFHRRDSSVLWPADVYTADGHCFDAEIAHPAHGRPFRPEITNILDVATRRAVGWSIDLAESGLAVLDALRFACETCGIPNLFYVDNGSGYKNALMSAAGVGMEERVGFTMTHALPYNSQAKGLMERSHQTIFVRAAKELPTYIGATMDAQAKQIVHKLTRKDVKAGNKSKYLMAFDEFVRFISDKIGQYNDRPHSGLPKFYDPAKGKKRHMTPNEAWVQGIKDGAQMVTISTEESLDLFRPQKECKILKAEIRLFGNLYFSKELEQFHGDVLRIAYDVRDPAKVWVYNRDGRFICEAGLNANKQPYFPESFVEQAARKRAKGREKRLLNQLDEVQAELQGASTPLTLENQPSLTLPLTGLELEEKDYLPRTLKLVTDVEEVQAMPAPVPTPQASNARPMFDVESEQYEWLMTHKDQWTQNDARFLQRYLTEEDGYALLSERFAMLDMAWGDPEQRVLEGLFSSFLNETSGQKNRLASV